MLIFELQDDRIKLASKLRGKVMVETPERYLFVMDYWENNKLFRQVKRLSNNPDSERGKELLEYQMIALSFITAGNSYYIVTSAILDSPYCVLWMTPLVSQERLQTVLDSAVELAGRIIDARN